MLKPRSIKMSDEEWESWKELCEQHGTTASAAIKNIIAACLAGRITLRDAGAIPSSTTPVLPDAYKAELDDLKQQVASLQRAIEKPYPKHTQSQGEFRYTEGKLQSLLQQQAAPT